MIQVRSPLKYIGGKSASAERIVAAFPDPHTYDTYVEPCGGAGHVLMAKPPYTHHEIFCDLDDNLTTFWLEMQSHAEELQARLDSLPYARRIYYDYYRSLWDGTQLEPLERAVRWFYVLRGTGTGWLRKSPVGWDSRMSNVQAFHSAIETFQTVQDRLRHVAIDNRDVLKTIKRYVISAKKPQRVLLYLDPPYIGTEQYYEPSKHGFPHEELALLLNSVKGYVALSYYPHPSIDAWYPGWQRVTWQQHKSSQIQIPDRLDIATEMLLTNYQPATQSLWNEEVSHANH